MCSSIATTFDTVRPPFPVGLFFFGQSIDFFALLIFAASSLRWRTRLGRLVLVHVRL